MHALYITIQHKSLIYNLEDIYIHVVAVFLKYKVWAFSISSDFHKSSKKTSLITP